MPLMDDLNESPNRRANTFAKASRHSKRVKFLKFALPIGALTIVSVLGFAVFNVRNGPEADVGSLALEGNKIVMANPKLKGVTGNNEPYAVEAQRALQNVKDVNDIDLEDITAQVPFGKGVTAKVIAPIGHLDNANQVLTLKGGFSLTTSDGLVANLQDAVLNFKTHSLKTDMPVDIQQLGTHITAGSLSVKDGGSVLVFEKNVRMVLQPEVTEKTKEPANGG